MRHAFHLKAIVAMNPADRLNQYAFTGNSAIRWYLGLQGFTDAGEQRAYELLTDVMRNQTILDLGVGGGRTVPLLRALSDNYIAIDYLPEMVSATRLRYQHVDVREGDARDLSRFGDGQFGLVVFSFNGLDSIDHVGRNRALTEVRRVLRPSGVFWFSTLNQQGPARRERPWRPNLPIGASLRRTARLVVRSALLLPLSAVNYLRVKQFQQSGDGWEIASLSAHHFGMAVHYTTLRRQLDELLAAGFQPNPEVIGDDGCIYSPDDDLSGVSYFHILART